MGVIVRRAEPQANMKDRSPLEPSAHAQGNLVQRVVGLDIDAEKGNKSALATEIGEPESNTPSTAGSTSATINGTTGRKIGEPSTWTGSPRSWCRYTHVSPIDDGRSAQPDEQRIVCTRNTLHGVGAQTDRFKTPKQRAKLLGVRDNVPGVVQCHPTAPETFNELSPHSVNSTSAPPPERGGVQSNATLSIAPLSGPISGLDKLPVKLPAVTIL